MEVKQLTIKEFITKIKEEGIDDRILNLTPSLDDKFAETNQDILNVLREYRDRVYWENDRLKLWLWKYDYFKEFREYYET